MVGERSSHHQITGGVFFSYVIQGEQVNVQLPPPVTPALAGLPAASPAFAGRSSELNAMLGALAPRQVKGDGLKGLRAAASRVMVMAVGGLAGIGKTELAIQAARAALGNGWFPGGALFVDMFGYDDARKVEPAHALEGFLRALGIPAENIPPATQDRARLYASVLAAYASQGHRVLVVIDNVSSHEQATPLLPTDGATGAIVTSRHTLAMLDGLLLDLNVLAEEDAVDLLRRALKMTRPSDTRIPNFPEDAIRIARLGGGLPLALRVIAALLAADPARPLTAIATDLSSAGSRLDELQYGNKAVRAAFDLSYQRLDAGHALMFRLFSVNPGPDISTRASAVLAGIDDTEARHTLESLARSHLIEPTSISGRWRMHDLVRLYSDQIGQTNGQPDARSRAFSRLLDYYLTSAKAANAHLDPEVTGPSELGFPGRPEALTWLDAEYPNLAAAIYAAASSDSRAATARDLLFAMWDFLLWRRHFGDWIALSAAVRDAARRIGDHDGETQALNSLGLALRRLRRFEEAIAVHQQCLQICRESGTRHGEGAALTNLGLALREVGRLDEAITAHTRAAEIFRETGELHNEGRALNNLGLPLREAKRLEEAITAHSRAVTISRDSADLHQEATALTNLGLAQLEHGWHDEAIAAHARAARLYQEAGDRHGEGIALNNLGTALREAGRLGEAIGAHTRAAQLYHETGDRHSEGRAMTNLGRVLQIAGRSEEAITAYTGAARLYDKTADHRDYANALADIEAIRQITTPPTGRVDGADA
jgi:tetratricopeptide (TPR) repeat protein